METISASVGVAHGKPCYNIPVDQEAVQRLLRKISLASGGCAGKSDWKQAAWGQCAPDLLQAIVRFQQVNRSQLDYAADGHVDPAGATIRLMNRLSQGALTGLPGGHGGLADSDRSPSVVMDLSPMFASGLVRTNWKLDSSTSLSGSYAKVAGSGGEFFLTHGTEKHTLLYAMVGVSVGMAAASLSLGTQSMPSIGGTLWTYGSRIDIDLQKLKGTLQALTGAATGIAIKLVGVYVSILWFGCAPGPVIALRIVQAISQGDGSVVDSLLKQMCRSCGAVGVLAGVQVGTADAGATLTGGWAW